MLQFRTEDRLGDPGQHRKGGTGEQMRAQKSVSSGWNICSATDFVTSGGSDLTSLNLGFLL